MVRTLNVPVAGEGVRVLTLRELKRRQQMFREEFLFQKATATRETYHRCLNEFGRWIEYAGGSCAMTSERMAAYLQYLAVERGLVPRSIATYLTALRQFCRYLTKTGFLEKDPTAGLNISNRPMAQATQPLTQEEVDALLAAVDTDTQIGKRDMAIIHGMLYAGLTIAEIERANVGDLQWTLHGPIIKVMVKRRRSRQKRLVPIPESVINRFAAYLRTRRTLQPEEPLVAAHSFRSKGGRIDARSVRRRITNYLEQAGIQRAGVTAQSLTRTALLLWLLEGKSMDEIKRRVRSRGLKGKVTQFRSAGLLS